MGGRPGVRLRNARATPLPTRLVEHSPGPSCRASSAPPGCGTGPARTRLAVCAAPRIFGGHAGRHAHVGGVPGRGCRPDRGGPARLLRGWPPRGAIGCQSSRLGNPASPLPWPPAACSSDPGGAARAGSPPLAWERPPTLAHETAMSRHTASRRPTRMTARCGRRAATRSPAAAGIPGQTAAVIAPGCGRRQQLRRRKRPLTRNCGSVSNRLMLGKRRRPPVADRAGSSTWKGQRRPENHAQPRTRIRDQDTTRPQADNHGADAPRPRIFCPMPGCPESDLQRAAGWQSNAALRPHLNDHGAGRCDGAVPATYHTEQRLDQCQICSRFLAAR